MPSCILRVYGAEFDVRSFLATSCLEPYEVVMKGRRSGVPPRKSDESGFKLEVADCDGVLAAQCSEAIGFLRRHRRDLARLRQLSTVTESYLDFGYWRRRCAMQAEYLPPELLLRAGRLGIGIVLSMYSR